MSNINTLGIDKLRFFTGDGNEILMEKQYSVEWEIVPSLFTLNAFLKNPKGHFELNLKDDADNIKTANVVVDDGGLIQNSITFTPYVCDESYLYNITDNLSDYDLADAPTYEKLLDSSLSSNYTYSITDDIGKILFFSYRATNKEDITEKQYSGIFNGDNYITLNNDIFLENNSNYYSFICNITAGARIEFTHSSDITVFITGTTNRSDFQKEVISTETVTTSYIESMYDGIMYISYSTSDEYFKAYRLDDRYVSNKLVITINSGEETVSTEFNLVDILQTIPSLNISSYTTSKISTASIDFLDETAYSLTVYTIKESLFTQTALTSCSFIYDDSILQPDKMSAAYYLMKYNVADNQYPYVRYIGSIMQDKVSTDLISSTTIVVVDDTKNDTDNGKERFKYPIIRDNDDNKTYQLHFKFQTDSEMSFITSNNNVTLVKTDTMFMPVNSNQRTIQTDNSTYTREDAMHFTVGFQSDIEGCYQNTMGMFIRDIDTNVDYFLGIIIFNTEVVDEDERFRALFQNFGIPDPIKYPNIFKSLDPLEEATDWKLINEKSKELFLSYDSIFPYIGTYKALFNAVKFLGYEDIIFKEWYKIKDTYENNKYVAIQTFDTSTGTNIASTLKNYNVEYGQYERYTKLNRLSMIYHLNQISDTDDEEQLTLYDSDTGDVSTSTYYNHTDIPSIYNIYEYRNDEVLSKLYSLKNWLEHYITGVNCYISDVNGEGIILDRIKTVGYVTEHEFKDILNKGYFTPNTIYTENKFVDSSATIICSLNEFDILLQNQDSSVLESHTGVTFKDYEDFPISHFIKHEHTVKLLDTSTDIKIYESCPISALTVADEYEFIANINNADSGSLYEFASIDSSDNPIMIDDGEITFFDLTKSQSVIETDDAPVILIKKGNLRTTEGSWTAESIYNTNIKYSIAQTIDADGNSYYLMTKFGNSSSEDSSVIRCKANVMFSPNDSATLKYSSNNNWHTPLFEIKNYSITNLMRSDIYDNNIIANSYSFFDSSTNSYILEIIEGEMKFSNIHKVNEKDCNGATILFAENYREEGGGEQVIKVSYSFKSDRMPIYKCNCNFTVDSSFTDFKTCCSSLNNSIDTTNTLVKIPVNRLGDYQIQVNAYDSYNNIFTNVDDDLCTISSKMPDIDIVINQPSAENSSDFYRYNLNPSILDDIDTSTLVHSIDKYIQFPVKYKLYNVQHNSDDYKITYDNISYAIDTPKQNDYLLLTNLTEQVVDISVANYDASGNIITLYTKRGNLGKQNFFAGQKALLCIYDDNLQEIVWQTTQIDTTILNVFNTDEKNSIYSSLDRCRIDVSCSPIDDISTNASLVNENNNINMYIISIPQFNISNDSSIINFYDSSNNRRCFIPVNTHTDNHIDNYIDAYEENYSIDTSLRLFPTDTMVKIRATLGDTIINETAYRIVDTSVYNYTDSNADVSCGYILDGHIDLSFLQNLRNRNIYKQSNLFTDSSIYQYDYCDNIKFTMLPLHTKPVLYCLRVTENASEQVYDYNGGFYAMDTTVLYNPNQLLFDSYFDDSYAMSIYDYDYIAGKEIWDSSVIEDLYDSNAKMVDSSTSIKEWAEMYLYKNHPVTIDLNRIVIIKTDENMTQLEKGFKNQWIWKVKTIEDNTNWYSRTHNVENITLFESINNKLCVRPYMLGSQSIELYCTDKYGNIISNTGGGNIYVK